MMSSDPQYQTWKVWCGQWCHQIHRIRLERCGAANDVIRSTVSGLKGVVMLYVLAQNPHGSGLLCGRTRILTPGSKSASRHCWPICPSSKHTPSYTIHYDEVWTVKHFTGPEYMWHSYTHDDLVLVCYLLDVEYLYQSARHLAGLYMQPNISAGLILGLRPVNERRRYFVTTSLIGWAQA